MDKKETDPQKSDINKDEDKNNFPLKQDKQIGNHLQGQALSDAEISKLNAIKSKLEPINNQQIVQAVKINQQAPQDNIQQSVYPSFSQNSLQNNWNGYQNYQNNSIYHNKQLEQLPSGYPNWKHHKNRHREQKGQRGDREHHGHGRREWHGNHGHHEHHGYRGHYGHHGYHGYYGNQAYPGHNQNYGQGQNYYGYPPPPATMYPPFVPIYGNNFSNPQQAPHPVYNSQFHPPPPPPPGYQHIPYPVPQNSFLPAPPPVLHNSFLPPPPVLHNSFLPPPPLPQNSFLPPQPQQFQEQLNQRHHRGRGCHRRGDKYFKRGRKGSDSSSSSSSSSQKSRKKSKGKKCGWKGKQKSFAPRSEQTEKYQKQIYQNYSKKMNGFFQSRQINQMQRDKIVNLLKRSYPAFQADTNQIIKCIQEVQHDNLTFRMSYVKIIKVLIKFRLDVKDAKQKLQHIQHKKIKKYEADQKFQETYGGKEIPPMFEVSDLINLAESNEANTLYIVDGNNIMPTNKHLRKYFQNRNHLYKICAQLRCRWYFSHVFNKQNIVLFFDQKFTKQDEDHCKKIVFDSQQQQKRAMDLQVIYGQQQKADEKIVDKMISLIQNNDKREVVLVTADRDLTMRCQEIKIMLYTSGKFFFKFCKYKINRNYKDRKPLKRLAKSILEFQQLY